MERITKKNIIQDIKNHYFINGTTNVTTYCLENYEEIKNEKLCNNICRKKGKYYERDNTGNRYIKAFQLFKILINNVGKLIIPMPLTEEVMETQFYDKVDEYNTLEYTDKSYRKEEVKEMSDIIWFGRSLYQGLVRESSGARVRNGSLRVAAGRPAHQPALVEIAALPEGVESLVERLRLQVKLRLDDGANHGAAICRIQTTRDVRGGFFHEARVGASGAPEQGGEGQGLAAQDVLVVVRAVGLVALQLEGNVLVGGIALHLAEGHGVDKYAAGTLDTGDFQVRH